VTMKFTVPFPVPLPGVTPVIHRALIVAVHAHPGVAVITMGVPAPPRAANDWDVWSSEYEQAAACWVTVNVCPATVSVPVRALPLGCSDTPRRRKPYTEDLGAKSGPDLRRRPPPGLADRSSNAFGSGTYDTVDSFDSSG
jgi:hypothetical protein